VSGVSELSPINSEELRHELEHLGLGLDTIAAHVELLRQAATLGRKPTFRILDTCRLDNGAVLPLATLAAHAVPQPAGPAAGYAAFVPAAGAASRYSQPLSALIHALEYGDTPELPGLKDSLAQLDREAAHRWPLPPHAARLLARAQGEPDATERALILQELQQPKALLPCVLEGPSFLALKHLEHKRLSGLAGEVYVTPPAMQAAFAHKLLTELTAGGDDAALSSVHFLEQGPALSTLRFNPDASPYRDEQGHLSPVPAGHGTLAQLFPEVQRLLPQADSVFVRNIDNVMGAVPAAVQATEQFLGAHRTLLVAVQHIRAALSRGQLLDAAEIAESLLATLATLPVTAQLSPAQLAVLAQITDAAERSLWELQFRLFHTSPVGARRQGRLEELYARPVNVMGQVRNTGNDVGGTPCFIETETGPIKICIEVPHASAADKDAFLADPAKATHFNPVFAAAEIPAHPDYYSRLNRHFWLLSAKTYRGQPVMYVETILYELLGNSDLANCVFIEVPRLVFNPHKTLHDAAGRTLADWLP